MDSVVKDMMQGKRVISINYEEDGKPRPLNHIILGYPLRDYFIKKVKAPLMKCIIFWSKKYPQPVKENCTGNWTEPFMDAFDRLLEYADYRTDLFEACRRIVLAEIEHDNFYRDPIMAMLEWLIEAVLDGKLSPRAEGTPNRIHWKEPPPYGGKYSVIYRIREKRKEINDLLGRKNV